MNKFPDARDQTDERVTTALFSDPLKFWKEPRRKFFKN